MMDIVANIFKLLGALGVFLYGMRVMSDGLQKVAGNKLHQILNFMTQNRVAAVITGFLITALVQSSSATTVMVVSFVNASLLSLTQAIGVIMGANIGTTVTTWIVSLIGFKFSITSIALPVVGIGLPLIFSKVKKRRDLGGVLIGFGLLFLGLMFLKESVPDIKEHPEVLEFLKNYTNLGFLSFVLFVGVGAVLTVIVQSSSAAMAITVTMAAFGWIDFQTAAAIVLGENIGTTVTAYLASLGTSVNARRTARAHFLFNVFGVIWMAFVFKYFLVFIVNISPWDTTGFLVQNVDTSAISKINLPLSLSLFHTVFNILNTFVFIFFIPQIAKLVVRLVPQKNDEVSQKYELQYISTGIQDTAQMNLMNAKQEISKMSNITENMFEIALTVLNNPDKKMDSKVKKVKQLEELTDQMQEEISKYLAECSKEELSEESIENVNVMMRIVHELESVADGIYRFILLSQHKYEHKISFHEKANNEIKTFSNLLKEFIKLNKEYLDGQMPNDELNHAFELEQKVNNLRNDLKKSASERLQKGADVHAELLYIDLIRYFEHIGDNSLNIAQALKNIH